MVVIFQGLDHKLHHESQSDMRNEEIVDMGDIGFVSRHE